MICACHSDGRPSSDSSSRTEAAPDAPVLVSTNDLANVLRITTNRPLAASAQKILGKHTVFLNPEGSLTAQFSLVSVFSTEYELVSKLAECLAGSSGKVRKQPDGSLLYINETKERFNIRVIHDECDSNHFEGVYYITTDRGFITIEALIHLESRPGPDGTIRYAVHIYADSNSRILNFLSRISLVRNYLTHEVNDMVAKFDTVYAQILSDPQKHLGTLMEFRDPTGSLYFSDREMKLIRIFVETLPKSRPTTETP